MKDSEIVMRYRKVTAVIPSLAIEAVEKALAAIGVPGMTITKVHGYGDYRNFYAADVMTDCARIEIFTNIEQAKKIVNVIAKTVHQGLTTDGVIAVLPVEEFIHIREFSEEKYDE